MEKETILEVYKYFLNELQEKQTAIELTKEWGLFERTAEINEAKKESAKLPASEKQLSYLKTLASQGFVDKKIPENLTKIEASEIIKAAVEKSQSLFDETPNY